MKLAEFEQLITDAIALVPDNIRNHMSNVAFVVEEESRRGRTGERPIHQGSILLGLYEGVPMTRRGVNYSLVLPDKITIFQRPLEELAADDPERLRALVTNTVHHEIGHHLGMDERAVRQWEKARRPKKRPSGRKHASS